MRGFANILRQLSGGRTDDHATDVARVASARLWIETVWGVGQRSSWDDVPADHPGELGKPESQEMDAAPMGSSMSTRGLS
ncbi:MAG: hypothetical protein OEL78_00135 [Hyphomicrobiales bacterium]|nr:hypothetical protein [Hyphomicrobiales bacterium]